VTQWLSRCSVNLSAKLSLETLSRLATVFTSLRLVWYWVLVLMISYQLIHLSCHDLSCHNVLGWSISRINSCPCGWCAVVRAFSFHQQFTAMLHGFAVPVFLTLYEVLCVVSLWQLVVGCCCCRCWWKSWWPLMRLIRLIMDQPVNTRILQLL